MKPIRALAIAALVMLTFAGCAGLMPNAATLSLASQSHGTQRLRAVDGREVSRSTREVSLAPGYHDVVVGMDDQLGASIGGVLLGDPGLQLGRALDMLTTPGHDQTLRFYAQAGEHYVVRRAGQGAVWIENLRTREVAGGRPAVW